VNLERWRGDLGRGLQRALIYLGYAFLYVVTLLLFVDPMPMIRSGFEFLAVVTAVVLVRLVCIGKT